MRKIKKRATEGRVVTGRILLCEDGVWREEDPEPRAKESFTADSLPAPKTGGER